MLRWPIVLAVLFGLLLACRLARADDLDDDDALANAPVPSWLTLGAAVADGGRGEARVFAELGMAWDGPRPRVASLGAASTAARLSVSDAAGSGAAPALGALPVTPRVARAAVRAALRAAHLLPEDALDSMAARARATGIVPEIRLRAMRLWDDTARVDATLTDDALKTTDTARANLWLEARAAFRLDRLLFAGEELAVARLRLSESAIAERIGREVVGALAAWQRAFIEARAAPSGSVAALDASVRASEAEILLDVLTDGWFSSWRAHEVH